jgi:DNA-binding NarL/FixJ family response regulator
MTTVVAIAGAGDLVENGLREIVAQAADIEVRDVWGVAPDVVLYDAMGLLADGGAELALLLESHRSAIVVVGRDLRPGLAARAIARGAFSCVSMEAPAHEILDAIRSAAVADSTTPATPPVGLGHEVHLTAREVMVVAGIARGMRNRDRRAVRPEPQHGQVVRAVRLPQDGCHPPGAGGRLVPGPRVRCLR